MNPTPNPEQIMHKATIRMRRELASRGPLQFAKIYLEDHFSLPFSRMHKELFSKLGEITQKRNARLAVAAPRGHAKTTIASLVYALWCLLYEKEKLILFISATQEQAVHLLRTIKEELRKNQRFQEDFPEICGEASSKISKPWRNNRILMANGAMVCAYGADQSLRGAKNGKHRPGLIIVDDVENKESLVQEEQREKMRAWFSGTLLHAGQPETNVVVVGTILHQNSLLLTPVKVKGSDERADTVCMRPPGNAQELERRRLRAVQLLKHGKSPTRITEYLGCALSSVYRWRDQAAQGPDGLRPIPVPGRPRKLTAAQHGQLEKLLLQGATAPGWPNELWTAARVTEIIRRHFGIEYHPEHVRKLLKQRLGWSSQKPELRARERNEAEIERWQREEFLRIKKSPA